jgi:hypothetical protein
LNAPQKGPQVEEIVNKEAPKGGEAQLGITAEEARKGGVHHEGEVQSDLKEREAPLETIIERIEEIIIKEAQREEEV